MTLTPDLICLLILALWSLPLNHIPAIARVQAGGLKWAAGNRDTLPEVPDWVGRADRAQRNHHDNLAMIAVVILVVSFLGQGNGVTAIASIILVASRIAHGLLYMAGIPLGRSLAYVVSITCLGVILWQGLF